MTVLLTPLCPICGHPQAEHEVGLCDECRIYGGPCDERPPVVVVPSDEDDDDAA